MNSESGLAVDTHQAHGTAGAAKLVAMANQIGTFFISQPGPDPAASIVTHLRKFWEPRMRVAIRAHLDAGGEGLHGAVREAVSRLSPTGI